MRTVTYCFTHEDLTGVLRTLRDGVQKQMDAVLDEFVSDQQTKARYRVMKRQYKKLDRVDAVNEAYAAMSYLGTWSMGVGDKRTTTEIFISDKTDFNAIYRHADGSFAGTLHAVWHGDHYGFHS